MDPADLLGTSEVGDRPGDAKYAGKSAC